MSSNLLTWRWNALHDRARKQAGRLRRQYHCSYSGSSSTLANDCNTGRISAESLRELVIGSNKVRKTVYTYRDVLLDPLQSRHHVRKRIVAVQTRAFRTYEESESTQPTSIGQQLLMLNQALFIPVVNGHDHHITSRCKITTVKDRIGSTTAHKSASVNPEHHRSE